MSRVAGGQMFLLPQEPRELADHIGLDWWAARKLHDDQWLSFDPEKMLIESDAMRAEFLFLGSLVAAGCDPHLLKRLLTGLEKPYSYDLSTIYYDWRTKSWKGHFGNSLRIFAFSSAVCRYRNGGDTGIHG